MSGCLQICDANPNTDTPACFWIGGISCGSFPPSAIHYGQLYRYQMCLTPYFVFINHRKSSTVQDKPPDLDKWGFQVTLTSE